MPRPRIHLFIDKRKWQTPAAIAADTRKRTGKPCADRTAEDKLRAMVRAGTVRQRGDVGRYEYRGQS
jgi:hypothetical protein